MTSSLPTLSERRRQNRDAQELRDRSVQQLMARYDFSHTHARQVSFLAGRLAEQLVCELLLGREDLDLLRYAALLHDIGWHYGQNKHHRNAYKLIKGGELPGFRSDEIERIALIARYHRKALPKLSHHAYARLDPMARQTVMRLAGVLRVADGLDRTHRSAVEDVIARVGSKGTNLIIRSRFEDIQPELREAKRKKKLLEIVLAQPVSLRGEDTTRAAGSEP